MEQFNNKEREFKRTKSDWSINDIYSKKWDELCEISYKAETEDRELSKEEDAQSKKLEYEITRLENNLIGLFKKIKENSYDVREDFQKAHYRDVLKEATFHDEEFFLKRAWDDFCKVLTEENNDILEHRIDKKILEATKDDSIRKMKKLDNAVKTLRQEKEEAGKLIESIVPNFFQLNKDEQLDTLDNLYKEGKRMSDHIAKMRRDAKWEQAFIERLKGNK